MAVKFVLLDIWCNFTNNASCLLIFPENFNIPGMPTAAAVIFGACVIRLLTGLARRSALELDVLFSPQQPHSRGSDANLIDLPTWTDIENKNLISAAKSDKTRSAEK
jgi:hypothetical protein